MKRLLLLWLAFLAMGADWPHWRGPHRNGTTEESSGWKSGKWLDRPAWQAQVGEGASSPIVVRDRLYVTGHAKGRDTLWCLDAQSGKVHWQAHVRTPRHSRFHVGDEVFYAGPCSTPEFDANTGFIFVLTLDGDLCAFDSRRRGAEVWKLNLYDCYGAKRRPKVGIGGQQRDYGYTSSPLILNDWLLVEVGGKDGNLAAFDKRSGKRVWVSNNKDLAGHTGGPALLTVEGVPCVVVLTLNNVVVTRLDGDRAGETVAIYPWTTEFANNVASPATHDDCVVVTSGYNQKRLCKLRVRLDGVQKVWESSLYSLACTPTIHQGHVYFAWQKIHCLDFTTGKPKWEGGFVGDPGSCLVTGDDRLVVWGQNGRLTLVETARRSPGRYQELARLDRLGSGHAWPHVAIASRRLYVKDRRGNLRCYSLPD